MAVTQWDKSSSYIMHQNGGTDDVFIKQKYRSITEC